jgi:hypothetical protein
MFSVTVFVPSGCFRLEFGEGLALRGHRAGLFMVGKDFLQLGFGAVNHFPGSPSIALHSN